MSNPSKANCPQIGYLRRVKIRVIAEVWVEHEECICIIAVRVCGVDLWYLSMNHMVNVGTCLLKDS